MPRFSHEAHPGHSVDATGQTWRSEQFRAATDQVSITTFNAFVSAARPKVS